MTVFKAGGVAIFATLALSACGGGGSPPSGGGGGGTPTAPPIVTRSYTFPAGDASTSSGTAWDITGVTTTLSGQDGDANGNSYDTLRVDVNFAQNVSNSLPLAGQQLSLGSQIGIRIALDTDANAATGNISGCTLSSATPFEYTTDQGNDPSRLADGNYSIIQNDAPISSGGENPPSEAMVSVSGNTFSETFFLSAINVHNGTAPPKIGVLVASFNGTGTNTSGSGSTDCVPIAPATEVFTI